MSFVDPCSDCFPGLLRQFEAHRLLRFLLSDTRAGKHMISVCNVEHPEGDEIAGSELAIDGQIKEREFLGLPSHLQSRPNRPEDDSLDGLLQVTQHGSSQPTRAAPLFCEIVYRMSILSGVVCNG